MHFNGFFTSQFSYCPLIWTCHSRSLDKKINKLHETCLLIVYDDKKSSFKEVLKTDKSIPIHVRNLPVLATKMFKVYRNMSPSIVRQLFQSRDNDYNLRQFSQFNLWNKKYFISWPQNLEYCS